MVASLVGTTGLILGNANCGGGSSGNTGGTTGTGGLPATGGTPGTGGTHTGGTTGTGGTATGGSGGAHTGGAGGGATGGSGGAATGGSGGAATGGSGGATATGGSGGAATGGSGGHTGGSGGAATGGSGGANTDGGTQQYSAFSYTFDKDVQGWSLNTYNPSTGGNLVDADGGAKATLSWDSSVGSPSTTPNGSLKIDATFSDYSQFAQAAVTLSPTANATGREVSVYVMLDAEDGGATWPGNVQVSASSGATYNGYTQIIKSVTTAGQWMQVQLPLTASSSFDPTQVIQLAVEFTTYSRPEGGSFGAPQHRTFHIDTVTDGSGLPPAPPLYATFDTSLNGLSLSDSSFKFPDGGAAPALTFDSTIGDPAAGSAKLVVPFNSYGQQLDTQLNPGTGSPLNLMGKTLHAKVRLDSGTFTAGYINFHVSAPDYSHYAQASTGSINATTLGTGQWVDLSIDLSAVTLAGFDPSKVIQVGVQFGTGSGPEGGAFPTSTQPCTFHIDSIVAQ
jgi:hypothetical protein